MTEIKNLTLVDLVSKVKSKEISSKEITQYLRAHINSGEIIFKSICPLNIKSKTYLLCILLSGKYFLLQIVVLLCSFGFVANKEISLAFVAR